MSGGRVTGGRRVDGRRDLFEMTVRPDSVADVTITLPAGRECGVSGAICTKGENRRQLTNTPTATVAGPEVSHENSPATGAPTIAGAAQVGETLTAETSGIADTDGLNNPNFAYQWLSCGGPTDVCILGATAFTYTLVADDAGKTIKVLVSFTDDAGNSESLASDTVVVSPASPPEDENTPATGALTITGAAQVGETLTAETSGIADADGLGNPNFEYQWISCGGPTDVCIFGATNSTYTLVADDAGKTIKVLVSFTDDAGHSESLESDTVVVPSTSAQQDENSPATGAPAIAGTAQVGETLTADISGIADADGLSNPNFAYQWVSCGGPTDVCILGATDSTYTLVAADAGKSVKVIVSFTDDAGNSDSLASNIVAVTSTPQSTEGLQPPGAPGMPNDSLTYNVEDGRNWVTFRWTRASGVVDGYEVLRRQNTRLENEWRVIARVDSPDATSYEDHTVIESSDYFFGVRAFNSAGRSGVVASTDCRNLDSVIAEGSQGLAYPENLTATLTENGTAILLTWTAPTRGYHGQDVSPVTGYQILRWDLSRGYPNYDIYVDNTGSTETSYVDRDITPNNTFLYTVRAWNDWGLGDRSFSATVRTMELDVIGAPRNLRVTSSSEGALLTWDAPEDVANTNLRYRIYRREHSGATVPLVLLASDHGATSYTDSTVVPGSEYHYQVRVDGDPLGSRHGIPTKIRSGFYAAPHDLSVSPVTPNADPAALSVADARVREGPDAVLSFAVTLDRPASGTVTVDYVTANGTATAESDYTATNGTLSFNPGETAKTVAVPILDDVHDEGEEAFTLLLSNASGARIADGVATGTIVNSDPLQKMWLSRFGRTVAGHVVDAVAGRLSGPTGGSQVTLGGREVLLDGSWPAEEGALPASWSKGGDFDPGLSDRHSGLRRERDDSSTRAVSMSELLLASSFYLASADRREHGPRWSLWGRGTRTNFSGKEGALTLDGDVSTGVLGADYESGKVLMGVALAYSAGDGSYTMGDVKGELESTLASVHPYLRYKMSERFSVWGVLGLGEGELKHEMKITGENTDKRVETDISMGMAAFGTRGALASVAGYDFTWKSDVLVVRTESEAVPDLNAADARTRRLRLMLEGSREVKLAEGILRPSLEVGLRYDGGDAETGSGLELGGGLRYANSKGFTMEVRARGLLAHEQSDYEEWGVSASVSLTPGAGGRGLSMRVGSNWGAASSGMDRLWSQRTAAGLARSGDFEPGAGLNAEVGYGLDYLGGLMTPYSSLSVSEGGQTYRVGGRFKLGERFTMSLEGNRREQDREEKPVHGVTLRGSLRW